MVAPHMKSLLAQPKHVALLFPMMTQHIPPFETNPTVLYAPKSYSNSTRGCGSLHHRGSNMREENSLVVVNLNLLGLHQPHVP